MELYLERVSNNIWSWIDCDGFEFDDKHPADDAALYETLEAQMRSKHSLPADIEVVGQ